MYNSFLNGIYAVNGGRTRRISSYDRSGGNKDWFTIPKGETCTLAEIKGSGVIRHIWMTINCVDLYYLRKIIIRMYWDGEAEPSVESPVGDFFGVGHGVANHYTSLPLNMVAVQGGVQRNAAMNCFFPMPFGKGARIEVVNEANTEIFGLYYYVDYEELSELPENTGRFHCQWKREVRTEGVEIPEGKRWDDLKNTDGKENYIILDAEGKGNYVGCNLSVDHLDPIPSFPWFGEGDDMIFIDGEEWPPSMHGTGTEDYFCAAWGYPSGKYDGLFHGISLAEPVNGVLKADPWATPGGAEPDLWYSGKWTMYRFHLLDPISFRKSIKVTIEHGHGNCHSSDYASTAYWYQVEPHKTFQPLPDVQKRLPRLTKESIGEFIKKI